MRRHQTQPRADWQKIVESQGMYYHTADGVPYWDESAYYEFTPGQIDALEKATYALDQMCLTAVEHVLGNDLLDKFLIPPQYHQFIRDSWEQDEHSVYGRFDLAYDGSGDPEAPGVQRRHAHRPAGSGGDPVALAQGRLPPLRPVQLDPRAALGGLESRRPRASGNRCTSPRSPAASKTT